VAAPARGHAARVLRRSLILALLGGAACAGPTATPDVDAAPDPDAARDAPGAVDAGTDAPPAADVGVLSLNLHCLKNDGTAYATNAARFAAIASTITAEQIDVVLAQELCVGAAGDARALLHAALASATGVGWASEVAATHRAWVGTPDEADEYVAIFTRGALATPRATEHRVQGSLRRVLLGATVTGVGATPLRVYTVHLDHERDDVRAAQGRDVASVALVEADDAAIAIDAGGGAVAMPVVIAGDFNSTSAATAPQALVGFGFVEASSGAAGAGIDHVFVHRSAPLAATSSRALFEGAAAVSDHPGVLVCFAAAAPTPVRLTRIAAPGTFATPLAVRGDRAPLTWTSGWPAWPHPVGGGPGVALVTSELPAGAFAYKFLRSDVDWQLGANATGVGQTDNQTAPTFP
jgi:endonuclease/exonuclease/phosphatase family metal-dependent hydrolase